MKNCKFCKLEKDLVECHIIPRAFFEYLKGRGNRKGEILSEITNSKDVYPYKSTRKGLYDPNLVCGDCEKLFHYDDYAIQLLLKKEKGHESLIIAGEIKGWKVKEINYKKLKLFFISLLWRASASSLKEFSRINIGPYLEIAKDAILSERQKEIERFSVILARFPDKLGKSVFLDPYMESKKGPFPQLNVCHFYLGAGYIAYIKVDKRSFPPDFESIQISNNKPLIILSRDFKGSKEISVMHKIYSDAKELVKKWT